MVLLREAGKLVRRLPKCDSALDRLEARLSGSLPGSLRVLSTVRLHRRLGLMSRLELYEPRDDAGGRDGDGDGDGEAGLIAAPRSDFSFGVYCADREEDLAKRRVTSQMGRVLANCLDWSEQQAFFLFPGHMAPMLRELSLSQGHRITLETQDLLFHLKDVADRTTPRPLAPNMKVEFLRRPHIDTVVRHWEYSSVIGADRVARSLEFAADHDLCYGVFVDGQLVSWLCTTCYGAYGYGHTLPEHQRSGHLVRVGTLATDRSLELGLASYATVEPRHRASVDLQHNFGMTRLPEDAHYIVSVPDGKKN